jgi:ABC-type multidrug transport system ATPase subunit
MQLFALIVDIDAIQEISEKEKAIIRSFLSRQLSSELVEKYMDIFDEYLHLYHQDHIEKGSKKGKKRTALTAVRILSICETINEELEQRQKVYVVFQMIEYIAYGIEIRETELDFLQTVASAFNIDEDEYQDILNFIISSLNEIPRKEYVLLINSDEKTSLKGVHHIYSPKLQGEISFLNIPSVNTYVLRYHGKEDLFLNGQLIHSGLTYAFEHGSSIRGQNIDSIYYTDVAGIFSTSSISTKLSFLARDVEFRFKNSENGIHGFNLHEQSGKLIGIMGGSGVGKSTLLNVLNGNLEPQEGEILINGHNLYTEKEKLNGVIGFIPQDDLLLEELTVEQNLYYNAQLCLNDYDDEKIREVVKQVLIDLDLHEIRDLKVGKPLNKVISGGQRKRVNIGLELIREPSILFVDEPTSGLSSVDSEMVMNLLREQTFKGKLVIINIHQPSSNLYKMFDRIIFMDKGGYQIYCGNPSEAVVYFKTRSNHANAKEDQCIRCGNVDPDQVLQIIEAKIVNEYGKLSRNRKVSPKEWFELFRKSHSHTPTPEPKKEELPENFYSIPGLFKQMKIFFSRDILSKLTNKQYILINLLEAPLLAVIMAFFTKYFSGTVNNPGIYVFRNNENLPAFLLMSVIVFLFLGLTISSEEIIKDRKILQRESFLNLSKGSYLLSKIGIMFLISAIQSISYVLIGNLIFEIKGMTLSYWLILFSTSCFANLLGLNISAGLNSVIAIYTLVPILLIPQILFCGVLVKFDKLHKSLTNYEYVPVLGDMMTSRWAYEALSVEQFKNNRYNTYYYDIDRDISNISFPQGFLIPDLKSRLNEALEYQQYQINTDRLRTHLEILSAQIEKLRQEHPHIEFDPGSYLDPEVFNEEAAQAIRDYFSRLDLDLRHRNGVLKRQQNEITELLLDELGGEKGYSEFQNSYYNDRLSDLVTNRDVVAKIMESDGKLIRKDGPVYMEPESRVGRAHLYAPFKKLGKLEIDTLWFNVGVIWMFTLLLYASLYFDVLRKILTRFENVRIRKKQSS